MEFWKAIFGLLRRISIGPPLALLSAVVGVGAYFALPTHYAADVSIVLASPVNGGTVSTDRTKQGLTNPFLSFNDALKIGASIVILSMNTQDVWTELGAPKDGPTKITIDDGRTNPNVLDISGPYIYIRVVSQSPDRATEVLMTARERVATELHKWQKALGAPPNTYITSTDIVPPARPEADYSTNWQGAIGAAVLCLFAGLSIAYGVERRRVLKQHPAAPVPQPSPMPASQPVQLAVEVKAPADEAVEVDLEDSSATMEFPAYREEERSPVAVPRTASPDVGEK